MTIERSVMWIPFPKVSEPIIQLDLSTDESKYLFSSFTFSLRILAYIIYYNMIQSGLTYFIILHLSTNSNDSHLIPIAHPALQ